MFDRTRPLTYKVQKLRIKLPKRDATVKVAQDSLLIDKLYQQYQLVDNPSSEIKGGGSLVLLYKTRR